MPAWTRVALGLLASLQPARALLHSHVCASQAHPDASKCLQSQASVVQPAGQAALPAQAHLRRCKPALTPHGQRPPPGPGPRWAVPGTALTHPPVQICPSLRRPLLPGWCSRPGWGRHPPRQGNDPSARRTHRPLAPPLSAQPGHGSRAPPPDSRWPRPACCPCSRIGHLRRSTCRALHCPPRETRCAPAGPRRRGSCSASAAMSRSLAGLAASAPAASRSRAGAAAGSRAAEGVNRRVRLPASRPYSLAMLIQPVACCCGRPRWRRWRLTRASRSQLLAPGRLARKGLYGMTGRHGRRMWQRMRSSIWRHSWQPWQRWASARVRLGLRHPHSCGLARRFARSRQCSSTARAESEALSSALGGTKSGAPTARVQALERIGSAALAVQAKCAHCRLDLTCRMTLRTGSCKSSLSRGTLTSCSCVSAAHMAQQIWKRASVIYCTLGGVQQ